MAKTSTMAVNTFVDGDGVVHVNDIYLSSGQIAMSTGKTAYATIIECAVRTRLGELALDAEQGLPYFETVFQSASLTPDFEAALRSRIEELYFVSEVVDLTTEFDRSRSVIDYSATIRTVDGDTITISNGIGARAFINDLIGTGGGGSMQQLIQNGQFFLPVHKRDGIQYYRLLTDDVDPDNGVQPAISEEIYTKNPTTGNFEEVSQSVTQP